MAAKVLELKTTLALIKQYKVFLSYDDLRMVSIWSPHTPLPLCLKRSIVAHRSQLHAMMLAGQLCANPVLHKSRRSKICQTCLKLDASMAEMVELETAS